VQEARSELLLRLLRRLPDFVLAELPDIALCYSRICRLHLLHGGVHVKPGLHERLHRRRQLAHQGRGLILGREGKNDIRHKRDSMHIVRACCLPGRIPDEGEGMGSEGRALFHIGPLDIQTWPHLLMPKVELNMPHRMALDLPLVLEEQRNHLAQTRVRKAQRL